MIIFQVEKYYRARSQSYLEILFKTAFIIAYYGLFRVGEITASPHVILARNVHTSKNKKTVLFVLESSKTHTKGDRPQKVQIKSAELYKQCTKKTRFFCPVKLIILYSNIREEYEDDNDQFLVLHDGTPLTAELFRSVLKKMLKRLGLDAQRYDTHSFRVGRATDLLKFGESVESIKKMGRWKSDVVFDYLRE